MKQISSSLIKALACAVLTFGLVASAHAADPTGTWTWTMKGRNDNTITNKLELKYADSKLTGALKTPKRGGDGENSVDIADGKVDGDKVSFSITREFNGNSFTAKYSGTLSADEIKGTIETERNGQTRSRDWTAKKSTEKPADK